MLDDWRQNGQTRRDQKGQNGCILVVVPLKLCRQHIWRVQLVGESGYSVVSDAATSVPEGDRVVHTLHNTSLEEIMQRLISARYAESIAHDH